MGELKDANTRDTLPDYIEKIANAFCGEEQGYAGRSDRLRHALGRIAKGIADNPVARQAENQEASSAADVAGVVADLNSLIIKLKNAGVMEGDEFTMTVTKSVDDSVSGHSDRQYNTNKISSVSESDGVITVTLSDKVSNLKDFDGGSGWGVHKWLGIGVSAGISPITNLYYNGEKLTAEDVTEATSECGLSAGYFVRWIAADLVLVGDNTQKSKGYFTLFADGYKKTTYTLKIVEPE